MPNRLVIKKNQRFGRLTVIREVARRKYYRYFLCKCNCGNKKEIQGSSLEKAFNQKVGIKS